MINTELLKEARKKKKISIRDMSAFLGAKSSATYYNFDVKRFTRIYNIIINHK